MKRLAQFFESLIFAGLKPGAAKPQDPLYLSNRTLGQKVRLAVFVSLPIAIVVGVTVVALMRPAGRRPEEEAVPSEALRRAMPNPAANVKIETNQDVVVLKAAIENSHGTEVVGVVQNNTDRQIRSAVLTFDVTDQAGSQLGGVTTTVQNLAPKAATKFRFPIKQSEAAFVLVREIQKE